MKIKLPKMIYVRRQTDCDNTFLVAEESLRDQLDVGETRLVGKYTLVEQMELSAEIKMTQKPKSR